ncbi:sugar phosphate isomerase/epimerase family protein [Stackebrandtia nassauensis]|uniref:Xylose isomerase domain protein TIM barrel n=1 Tax=Stackebrandtia nassauensis (strain DSM 44728 / CIP 108903 / NRRL B-16338 / NBRC 102104 / LLR-40K-21) TaxID=446470 RepID=D3PVP7_STANL|nr:sugar phosphate isomerase/epimerase [Stackebrandtia nassauensis]ADD43161.1 Xylose isomerase domain protein TIM barrel [Stackebrandtia nassauensis DSM 44728]
MDAHTHPPALQLYSIRDPFAQDPLRTLQRVAEIGYRQLELWGIVENLAPLRDGLRDTGLTAPTAHARITDSGHEEAFAAAKDLGVDTVIEPYVEPKRWEDAADIAATASRLNELAGIAADHGLRLGYHNHWWELKYRVGDRTAFEVFADQLDPAVILEVDTYWATVGGVDAAELLRRLGDRVHAIHVKDGGLAVDGSGQVPAGRGSVPVTEILAAAPTALRIVEFDHYDGDIFDAVAASFTYLTGAER